MADDRKRTDIRTYVTGGRMAGQEHIFINLGLSPFTDRSKADHLCFLCLVFLMLSCLFIAALWSPAGQGLTGDVY